MKNQEHALPKMVDALRAAYQLATSDRHDGDDVAELCREALSTAGIVAKEHEAMRDALQKCIDLLDEPDVQHHFDRVLGKLSPLHKALGAARLALCQ